MSYPLILATPGMNGFAEAVDEERQRQIRKFGDQRLPNGTGHEAQVAAADFARQVCDAALADGTATYALVFTEEAAEALAESDPVKLRAELVQVAAVCAKWVDDLDRQANGN